MIRTATAVTALGLLSFNALAQSQGDWLARFGIGFVNPDVDSGDLVFEGTRLDGYQIDVDDDARPVVNLTWMASDRVGIELLAAWPFQHDIDGAGALADLGRLGRTKHLPPTLSLQYHFLPGRKVRPYAGVGLNYTLFFDESTTDGLHEGIIATANAATGAGFSGGDTSLDIKDSFGVALQAGIDFHLTDRWFLNADARWIRIEADARLTTRTTDGGGDVTLRSRVKADLDPWVLSATVGYRF